LVFVVLQVDGEGYVIADAYANAARNMYTEDSLKNLAKALAPDCTTKANVRANGR
jgi:hypothetical protein